jgi:DNA-binding MarR family transcriptional regulator
MIAGIEHMSTIVEDPGKPKESLSKQEYRDRLRELPPSAKLVAKILETDGPLSQGRLAEESLLPDRTVRYALNRLEESDLVESRYSVQDARKQVYSLAERV